MKFSAEKWDSLPRVPRENMLAFRSLPCFCGEHCCLLVCPSHRDSLREETLILVHNFSLSWWSLYLKAHMVEGLMSWWIGSKKNQKEGQILTLKSTLSGLCPIARSQSSTTWREHFPFKLLQERSSAPQQSAPFPQNCLSVVVVAMAGRGSKTRIGGRETWAPRTWTRKKDRAKLWWKFSPAPGMGRSVALFLSYLCGCGLFLSNSLILCNRLFEWWLLLLCIWKLTFLPVVIWLRMAPIGSCIWMFSHLGEVLEGMVLVASLEEVCHWRWDWSVAHKLLSQYATPACCPATCHGNRLGLWNCKQPPN